MTPALIGLGASAFLEWLLWTPFGWRCRKIVATSTLVMLGLASGWLLVEHFGAAAWLCSWFAVYRLVNLWRIVAGHDSGDYLFHVARRASLSLMALQLSALGLVIASPGRGGDMTVWWTLLASAQLVGGVVVLASTMRHIRTTRPPLVTANYSDQELPTLTVAIPARNETDDLEDCLQSLVLSSYPKLEILVLDDCSQERRTPEIIKGFAHAGVRFIAGTAPPEHWLAKNYAYEQLANEANGELVLFCGVDARFQADSLDALVSMMLQKKKSMISVIPQNLPPSGHFMASAIIQPCRYAWELALPRRLFRRPPVLSTCWLARSALLRASGGFQAVRRSISPESYFARQAIAQEDGYSFTRSDTVLGVSSFKNVAEQRATAIRTRYPQLHRRIELVGLVSLVELLVLVGPFILAIAMLSTRHYLLASIALLNCALLVVAYVRIVSLTYQKFLLRGLLFSPVAPLYDIGLLNYSMWRYEFSEVIWKDRNVCLPVMRIIPRLPEL